MNLNAREVRKEDIPLILNYWYSCSEEYLRGMGADINKLPSRDEFGKMIENQIEKSYEQKNGYATIWEIDGVPCGHCNINGIKYGEVANMHLHMWKPQNRKRGMGITLVKKSIALFFENFELKKIICEPYALNPAPNKLIPKLGFDFIKKYHTTPGSINFPQEVNCYTLSKEKFQLLSTSK